MGMQYRTIPFDVKFVDAATGTFEGYGASWNLDDGGDIILPGAFKKTIAERANRIKICYQHDWRQPIGKPMELREEERGLYVKAMISDTSLGRDVRTLMKDGVISELSIGYDPIKVGYMTGPEGQQIRTLQEIRLYEISPVTVAMNPAAVITDVKAAIPFKKHPLADEGAAWDGPGEIAAADVEDLRQMCAIVLGDGENKGDYKLPHHTADGYATVWKGVAAAMAACMGARGGVQAPAADIAGAKRHLAQHYREFDKPVPGEAGFEPAEHLKDYEPSDRLSMCIALLEDDPEYKVGRVLSSRNRGIIEAAMQALRDLLAAAEPQGASDEDADALTAQDTEKQRMALRLKLLDLEAVR